MPMQGSTGRRSRRRLGGRHSTISLTSDYTGARLRAGALAALMRQPPRRVSVVGLKDIARFPQSWDFSTYLALQGLPLVGIGSGFDGVFDSGIADTAKGSLCLLSPADVARGDAIVYGKDDALNALAEHLAAWRAQRRPSVARLRLTAELKRLPGGNEIPRPSGDGTFEFVRGAMRFRAWYES
jgi:hypothetical protein